MYNNVHIWLYTRKNQIVSFFKIQVTEYLGIVQRFTVANFWCLLVWLHPAKLEKGIKRKSPEGYIIADLQATKSWEEGVILEDPIFFNGFGSSGT